MFDANDHSFNLDYPPPAFIGDINHAPVILLQANGGYDPVATASEFSQPGAIDRYLDRLRNPRAVSLDEMAPYYRKANYAKWIVAGQMVLVNAVAYRSKRISKEPNNRRVAELLPSTEVHQAWLHDVLVPSASRGERLIVVHRNSLWGIERSEPDRKGVLFSKKNWISPHLSREMLNEIRAFLAARCSSSPTA